MIGGYSFERSKFNRATQAFRQVGSAFKPFVYTTAIDRGYTPTTILQDSPVTYPGGAGQPPYSPQNYDKKFEGPVTLRRALEHSRNVPAIASWTSWAPSRSSPTRAASASRRRCRPTSRSRSAPPTRR